MKSDKVVSNKDETIPLFQNAFLEKFTHIHPALPVIIYVPVIVYFLYRTVNDATLTFGQATLLFLAGVFAWTFVEYVFHRYIFHFEPSSKAGQYLHFLMHGVHHAYPRDSQRLVMAPVVSAPLALLFYVFFAVVFESAVVSPLFAGFIAGYLAYDMIHYATHHFPMRSSVGLWLKHHHLKHHYQDDSFGYGVSSPLWDWIFRTNHRPKKIDMHA